MEKGNQEFLLAQELLRTASRSLSEAIKEENMTRIAVANELMSVAQKKYEEYATHKSAQFEVKLERKENLPLTPCRRKRKPI